MRHIILAILLSLIALPGVSQSHYEGTIAVGGKAGATFSRVNFNPGVEQTMLPGATFGAMFRYIEEKHFGLIAELNMAQRGWKETFDDAPYRFNHRFTYIELPIMTHIFFGGQRIKGFFNLGPEIEVMIGDKISSNFAYQDAATMEYFLHDTRHIEQMTAELKNKLDYGICAGVGFEVNLSRKHSLLLEGRFYYGLTDAFANHKTDTFSSSNSMSVMVTLGYFYRLK